MFIPEVDESAPLEAWQVCWRGGLADALPTEGLVALRDALVNDDPALIQGQTVAPIPFLSPNAKTTGCCPISYCGWRAFGLDATADVYAFYHAAYYRRNGYGYENGSRDFTEFVDGTPRDEMRKRLVVEVNRTLKQRGHVDGELPTGVETRLRAGALDEGVGSAA